MAHDLTLIALDPGGRTGWALLTLAPECLYDPSVKILESITHYTYGEFGIGGVSSKSMSGAAKVKYAADIDESEHAQIDAIEDLVDAWPGCAVVREDFILRTANQNREVLSPVRLGFAIDHLLRARGKASFTQQPAMAKTTASDDRLKAWGLYRPGSDHSRDATRHAIVFARRAKENRALLLRAWPRVGRLLSP